MSRRAPHAIAIALAAATFGCAGQPARSAAPAARIVAGHSRPPTQAPAVAVARDRCSREAERLTADVTVLDAPGASARTVARLPAGRFVYRCESRDGWQAIQFAGPDEKVDCSFRPKARPCATGWIRGAVHSETMD